MLLQTVLLSLCLLHVVVSLDQCPRSINNVDALLKVDHSHRYVFSGESVWKMGDNGALANRRYIYKEFDGFPRSTRVTSATYNANNGYLLLVVGDMVYSFEMQRDGTMVMKEMPYSFSSSSPRLPITHPDFIFAHTSSHTMLVHGYKYARYEPTDRSYIDDHTKRWLQDKITVYPHGVKMMVAAAFFPDRVQARDLEVHDDEVLVFYKDNTYHVLGIQKGGYNEFYKAKGSKRVRVPRGLFNCR